MGRHALEVWIAAIAILGLALAGTSLAAAATTQRVDVSSSGEQSKGYPGDPAISADGRYVAFSSDASNLVPGDTNGKSDVFVRDRKLNRTTRVSVSSSGHQANGQSFDPAISANGRYVAFESNASNLPHGDGASQVFVRDLKLHKTTMVSVAPNGEAPDNESYSPAISANGRYIAFVSRADLVSHGGGGQPRNIPDVFVRDQKRGKTRLVSVSSSGRQSNNQSFSPAISANGRYVAFESRATNLVHHDTNKNRDVFVRDVRHHTTKRVSVSSSGHQANGDSEAPAISADGRYVVLRLPRQEPRPPGYQRCHRRIRARPEAPHDEEGERLLPWASGRQGHQIFGDLGRRPVHRILL
jgi:Tol biopolymer transport system component